MPDRSDPAAVIAAALDAEFVARNGSTDEVIRAAHADTARIAVAALAAAELSAVAVESSRIEWALRWGAGMVTAVGPTNDPVGDERLARGAAAGRPWDTLVQRVVHVGPWRKVVDDA